MVWGWGRGLRCVRRVVVRPGLVMEFAVVGLAVVVGAGRAGSRAGGVYPRTPAVGHAGLSLRMLPVHWVRSCYCCLSLSWVSAAAWVVGNRIVGLRVRSSRCGTGILHHYPIPAKHNQVRNHSHQPQATPQHTAHPVTTPNQITKPHLTSHAPVHNHSHPPITGSHRRHQSTTPIHNQHTR